jgi:hypothetical protein
VAQNLNVMLIFSELYCFLDMLGIKKGCILQFNVYVNIPHQVSLQKSLKRTTSSLQCSNLYMQIQRCTGVKG